MSITLGIDIGTTKCAAVCFDTSTGKLLEARSFAHHADQPCPAGGSEQDVRQLLDCVVKTVRSLPEDMKALVTAVGVTGQMHSVMGQTATGCHPLVTWQDKRCGNAGLLEEFSRISGHILHDGFGAATLARLGSQTGSWLYAATIMDHLVCLLCGNDRPVTDPANAASWGIFDGQNQQWDFAAAKALGIRQELLPEIRPSGSVAGKLCRQWSELLGLPENICVTVATGDNQASILGTGRNPEQELFLTLGTGAQLSAVVSEDEAQHLVSCGKLEVRPFPGNRKLAVCSCLCGGKAFSWIGETLQKILSDLDMPVPPLPELLDRIDQLGLNTLAEKNNSLQMDPSFLGERGEKKRLGTISGISLENFTIGNLAAADAEGILNNLLDSFPQEILRTRTRLLGSGNGIRRIQCIQKLIKQKFQQEFELLDTEEEAACGAAVLASYGLE